MAGLSITGQMKVSTLQEGFLKEFGLTLRVYDGRAFADPTQTLAQVRKKKGSGKDLSVAKNMKVGNLEDKFEEEFGLKVQVAGSDDSYLCKDELTLNAAQQDDEKKLARKERKAARQGEASDDGGGDDFIIEDSETEGVMEVSITDVDGVEHIYWVDLSKLPEDEDEYDWSIEISKLFHAKTKGTEIEENDDEGNIFASEPFTRTEEEFVWVNKKKDFINLKDNSDKTDGNNAVSVCLSFDSIKATYIETKDGDWIDEIDDLSAYRFEGTAELDPSSLGNWCNTNIDLEFDGDLDDPDVFTTIKAVKVCGPTIAEYSPEGLILESVSFYFLVTGVEDIDDSNLDDLFHISVPILSFNGSKMAFTEFEEYEASFEEVPNEGKDISTLWTSE
jgi:hypothetical protein